MIHALHGSVGMAEDWQDLLPEGHAWNLWDLLSQGERTLAEAGEMVARAANDGDILVGYSMGGRIALHALLSGQCQWGKAIIISAHPGLESGREERIKRDREWAEQAESDWGGFYAQWNAQEVLSGEEPKWGNRHFLEKRKREIARSFRCWSLGQQVDLLPFLHRISCPVTWVVGEKDQKFRQLGEKAVEKLERGKLYVVPEAGHRVPWFPGFNLVEL